jgi:hypothetical protein
MNPGAIERILRGPESRGMKRSQAEKIASRWKSGINRVTGATDRSVGVEEDGDGFVVAADTSRDPESAWFWLEYGTSKMRAQAPGRRSIRGG